MRIEIFFIYQCVWLLAKIGIKVLNGLMIAILWASAYLLIYTLVHKIMQVSNLHINDDAKISTCNATYNNTGFTMLPGKIHKIVPLPK